jgi:nitroreductase
MASFTPSVCNRQNWKVFVFTSAEDKRRVLAFQNGNRGFGDQASKILLVTADLQGFVAPGERNQGWIDGGMFAMSLLYLFHSLGVGTCCLNWSVKMETDQNMKAAAGIPDSHGVIMLIAVGHYPVHLRVAQSPRKPLRELVVVR